MSLFSSHKSLTHNNSHYNLDDNYAIYYFPYLQLCDLYENDSIFDKFECCLCDAPFPKGPVDHRQPAENLCLIS